MKWTGGIKAARSKYAKCLRCNAAHEAGNGHCCVCVCHRTVRTSA
jgi:hypothetical protein